MDLFIFIYPYILIYAIYWVFAYEMSISFTQVSLYIICDNKDKKNRIKAYMV